MKSQKRLFTGAAVAVAALLVLPFLISLGHFIAPVERFASEQLKAPATQQAKDQAAAEETNLPSAAHTGR